VPHEEDAPATIVPVRAFLGLDKPAGEAATAPTRASP
jgi:hypothetical protein